MKRLARLLTLLALGGCASIGSREPLPAMSPPQTPQEARQQLEQLERLIADNRQALGLPLRQEAGKIATGGARAPSPVDAPPSAPAPAPAPADPRAEAASEAPACAARASDSMQSESLSDARRSCSPRCRYTRAICAAAQRICNLARYLGEADAFERCRRAEQDCRAARRATADRDCDDCG